MIDPSGSIEAHIAGTTLTGNGPGSPPAPCTSPTSRDLTPDDRHGVPRPRRPLLAAHSLALARSHRSQGAPVTPIYDHAQLYDVGPQRTFTDECSEVVFLLGGIGTGNVSVGARVEPRNWEIFGTPGKGNFIPNTFFAIWTRSPGAASQAKVLESRLRPPFAKARGFVDHEVAGLPGFVPSAGASTRSSPSTSATTSSRSTCSMKPFTPFVPLHADDSGLPTAILRYCVTNTGSDPLDVSVVGSMGNVSSMIDYHRHTWDNYDCASENVNEYVDDGVLRGASSSSSTCRRQPPLRDPGPDPHDRPRRLAQTELAARRLVGRAAGHVE